MIPNPLLMLPAKVRFVVYLVAGLAMLGLSAWQASDGDWQAAVPLFLAAVVHATAASHTKL